MICVKRGEKIIRATVPLTPSKSITNRALIIKALSSENIELYNEADAEDSRILKKVLSELSPVIDVRDAGTAYRFMAAFLSAHQGTFTLTGSERMKARPVGKLVAALRQAGASIEFLEKENYPPLVITGKVLKGGKIFLDASESSQFVSALLLIGPTMSKGLQLELTGKIYSRPYIVMTLSLMQFFGIRITSEGSSICIPHQEYSPKAIRIENDWSSAAFWYLIVALSKQSEITLNNLFKDSIQGDSVIAGIMEKFGVRSEFSGNDLVISKVGDFSLPVKFDYDFTSCPDLVIPVATLCTALRIPCQLSGVKNLRIKESDRLLAIKTELEKIGAIVSIEDDSISIMNGQAVSNIPVFYSHNDHRIVMSLAPLSLLYDEIFIDDHLAVNKSYPEYWRQLRSAGFSCELT